MITKKNRVATQLALSENISTFKGFEWVEQYVTLLYGKLDTKHVGMALFLQSLQDILTATTEEFVSDTLDGIAARNITLETIKKNLPAKVSPIVGRQWVKTFALKQYNGATTKKIDRVAFTEIAREVYDSVKISLAYEIYTQASTCDEIVDIRAWLQVKLDRVYAYNRATTPWMPKLYDIAMFDEKRYTTP